MTSITTIITGHREGLLAGPSIASAKEAVAFARGKGLTVESIVVLDRPDDITRLMFADLEDNNKLLTIDVGDPAASRNRGVSVATGDYIAFLDADDLWSFNWLVEAYRFCEASSKPVIAHSAINVVFGLQRTLWSHADSEAPNFDWQYLRVGNYWDAMCFADRQILLDHPMTTNDLKNGYGHEDWHWNRLTLEAGIAHRPVPGTVHFKRRRKISQMSKCADNDVVPWPTVMSNWNWQLPTLDRKDARRENGPKAG